MLILDHQIANGISIEVSIKHTNRKSVGLKLISASRLEITAPKKASQKEIMTIIQEKHGWLLKHISAMKSHDQQTDFENFREHHEILLLGKRMNVDFIIDPELKSNRIRVHKDSHSFLVSCSQPISATNQREALNQWSKKYAKSVLIQRVQHHSQKLGIDVNNVVIKEQKTRWGSCSSKGNINLNWRLIKAPIEVIDYIVIHELLHRIEMNHSAKFWTLVQKTVPEYRLFETWLKRHHKLLNL